MTPSIQRNIKFTNIFRKLNLFSIILVILSVTVFILKGFNLGVDFKGGTLIEIRTAEEVKISQIRQKLELE